MPDGRPDEPVEPLLPARQSFFFPKKTGGPEKPIRPLLAFF